MDIAIWLIPLALLVIPGVVLISAYRERRKLEDELNSKRFLRK